MKMAMKNKLSFGLIVALATISLQAAAQSKPLPEYIGPIAPGDPSLSAPSVDAGQALDVSVKSNYYPITPCRLADTRFIPDGAGGTEEDPFGQQETRGFWGWAGEGGSYEDFGGFAGECGIPSTATAVHVNFTIVAPKGNGYLRTWPNNVDEPNATVFAWDPGFGASNAVTVAICSDSTESTEADFGGVTYANCPDDPSNPTGIIDFWVKIYGQKKENLVIDALGYYAP
ncbi:hypothetical protein N9241_02200 [bacterium]|nr:hypothetical protein [bacterium]